MPTFGAQIVTSRIPILGLIPEQAVTASAPANPVEGLLWHDTQAKAIKVWLNGQWNTVSTGGGSAPTGPAGGDLTGTYPNPTIAALTVTDAKVATANKDGVAGLPSMRTIGVGALQAMAGNTRLDTIAAPTGSVGFNGQRGINLADGTGPTDAVTLQQAQAIAAGLDPKNSVKAASTATLTLSGAQTVDTVALVAGDRVLVKDQTTPATNGIYVVAAGAWTRATDMDSWAEVPGASVFVEQGSAAQKDTGWVCTADQGGTLGTTAITWTQFYGPNAYVAGNGLTSTGNQFDVNPDGATIEVVTDQVRVKDLGITGAKIANVTVDLTTKVTGVLPVANGGTGANTAVAARASLGALGRYAADLPALSAGVQSVVTHNLNSLDVAPRFRTNADGSGLELTWQILTVNTIGVTADLAYAAAAVRVIVLG